MWQQVASTIQSFLPVLFNIILKVQTTMMIWEDFQLTCPPGEWSVALLPGQCLRCHQDGFVVLRSDQSVQVVQCCDCGWTTRVVPDSWIGRVGTHVLLAADLLELARIKCPEVTDISVLPGRGVA